MAKVRFTDADVAKLGVGLHADRLMTGHFIRVLPSGAKSFVVVTTNAEKKQQWKTLKRFEPNGQDSEIEKARVLARAALDAIREGLQPPSVEPYRQVAESWIKRVVKKNGFRAEREYRRYLDIHILPAWGAREFKSIRRHDVATLLDAIEDDAGPVAADNCLKVIRMIANWYATRSADYVSPIVKGMQRSKPSERARDRTLSDAEIAAVWRVAESNGGFGAFVRLLLLTAQRREKVVAMRWQDLGIDGVWSIPIEKREKGNGGALKLPAIAVEIIRSRPRMGDNPYVFAAARGNRHMTGFNKMKAALDARTPDVAPWRLHDLRRTARSLMARAGVPDSVAERVLGHAQGGVQGIYNRHDYRDEKAEALCKLAKLIEEIACTDLAHKCESPESVNTV
jgi:integrase